MIPGGSLNPFEELVKTGRLHQPQFTVAFVKAPGRELVGKGGRLTLGGLDEEKMLGSVEWVSSTAKTFWGSSFEPGAIRFGGVAVCDPDLRERRYSEW